MKQIACLPPTKDLADLLGRVGKDLCLDLYIEVVPDLSLFLEKANKLADQGIQVVISRGVAAWKIKLSQMGLSVVNIPVTGFDLLKALDKAKKFPEPFGICEIAPVIRIADAMQEYTGISLIKKVIDDYGEIEDGIKWLNQEGVKTVIGRIFAAKLAKEYGMHAVTLTSSTEAVAEALDEAERIVNALQHEKARTEQFKTILDFAYEGILAVNANGIITFFNPVAERILGISKENAIGHNASQTIPNTRLPEVLRSGKPVLEEVQDVKGTKIITNRVPIIVDGLLQGAVATFQEVVQLQNMEQSVRRKLNPRGHIAQHTFRDILGQSKEIKTCINRAYSYARVDSNVLILGDTGTGKEVFAQAIHNASVRCNHPFVAVNCASLPENLLESELFGYEEGAFTGARKGGKPGLFELAHGGTIFLDEIPEMTHLLQSELLRVIEQREVTRLGDDKVIPVDVRIITSSNEDLEVLIQNKKFRQDLYYRLNVLRLELPPLNKRKEDIFIIANSFLVEMANKHHGVQSILSKDAMEILINIEWSGNVRELQNVIERVVVTTKEKVISAESIRSCLKSSSKNLSNQSFERSNLITNDWEKDAILMALNSCNGNRSKAAAMLGIGRTTLWRKLKNMDINLQ